MKHSILRSLGIGAVGLTVLTTQLVAQTSAFTYQGSLTQYGQPANGTYDFMFRLMNAPTDGAAAPVIPINPGVGVTNGLFTTGIDFGAESLNGANLWLEISVRTNGGGTFTTLAPRQLLTSAPYAVKALEAVTAAEAISVPQGTITSMMLADGAVTSAKIAPGAVSQLGTPDNTNPAAVQVNDEGNVGVGAGPTVAQLNLGMGGSIYGAVPVFQTGDGMGVYTNLGGTVSVAAGRIGTDQIAFIAIVAEDDDAVTVVNTGSPDSPQIRANIKDGIGGYTDLNGACHAVFFGNTLAVAANRDNAVTLVGFASGGSESSPPQLRSVIRHGVNGFDYLHGCNAVAVSGNVMAIAARQSDAVTLVDVSNPSLPMLLSVIRDEINGFTEMRSPATVSIQGNKLAIGSDLDLAVTIVDISDATNPMLFSVINHNAQTPVYVGQASALAWSGELLAVTSLSDRALLFDLLDPFSPVLKGSIINELNGVEWMDDPWGVAITGNLMAVSSGRDSAVSLFDISDPASPRLQGVFRDNQNGAYYLGGAKGLVWQGGRIVVAGSHDSGTTILEPRLLGASLVTDGAIGIGMPVPAAPLHVRGNVIVEGAAVSLSTLSFSVGFDGRATGPWSSAFGTSTTASGDSAIAAGSGTIASGLRSLAIGRDTVAEGVNSFAGGEGSKASNWNTVAFGWKANASGNNSIALGENSLATAERAVAVGYGAQAVGPRSVALGHSGASGADAFSAGDVSFAQGNYSVALGRDATALGGNAFAIGFDCDAVGDRTAALGYKARANHMGSFVWGDSSSDLAFESTNTNQFAIRAAGGVRITSNSAMNAGVSLAPGATSWSVISDRAAKKDFTDVDIREVLEKLAAVPVQSWHYQWESADATPHLGPVAQDFKAAFYPGRDDKSITTLEFDGVALAAIQGLNQKLEDQLEQKQTEITELRQQNAELLKRLEAIEARLR